MLVKKGSREKTYLVDIVDGIPFIRRYGKRVSLEGFFPEDGKIKGQTLATYIQNKKAGTKISLFSFKDFQQFIYISTICKEEVVKEIITLAKNISKNISKEDKKSEDVFSILEQQFKYVDEKAVIINGFKAKRIR